MNYAEKFQLIETEIETEISEAFEFAINSNSPTKDQIDQYIYA